MKPKDAKASNFIEFYKNRASLVVPDAVKGEVLGIPHLPKAGRYPGFPVRSSGKDRVCAFLQGKAHEVQGTRETSQEIGDMGHPSFVRGQEKGLHRRVADKKMPSWLNP
jgi:hypothetical protein